MKRFLESILGNRPSHEQTTADPLSEMRVATAALLMEIARVDNEFTREEHDLIVDFLKRYFGLDTDDVETLLEAAEKELDRTLDLYYFAKQINNHFSKAQKIEIIEMAWKVVLSDERLTGHEDQLVHRFARLLKLDHSDLIAAKLRVKNA